MNIKKFVVHEGDKVNLGKWATIVPPFYTSKKQYEELLAQKIQALSDFQQIHYAANQYSILLIFQAMDAAGKDGVIRHVLSGINPQGCQVYSFKHPSATELAHDFLWRSAQFLPERGRIGVFNRSYYEEVLIVRVHPEILRGQNIPNALLNEKRVWDERYRSILGFEDHLNRNGTKILKFFLHISEEEQRKRLLARVDDPNKNWKITPADIEERQYWKDYMKAYGDCLSATSTKAAPWYVVPADDKLNARLIIAEVIAEAFQSLNQAFPTISDEQKQVLHTMRESLTKPSVD